MARKKKSEEHVNHERWLVSYADFITLLFAFFTTLYAISSVDAQKMGKMVMSMRASFDGNLFSPGGKSLSVGQGMGGVGTVPIAKDIVQDLRVPQNAQARDAAVRKLKELKANFIPLSDAGTGRTLGSFKSQVDSLVGAEALKRKSVITRLEGRGLVISLGEGGFFDSGSDQIKPAGLALLDTIATGLTSVANHIRIEGHTDNVPIRNSRFPSNWELSTARATVIVAHLLDKFGLPPERVSAAGYAEYRPVASNDTEEGRARNRRVDIIVLNPRFAEAEPTDQSRSQR